MSRLGFRKVVVCGGGTCLGEVDVVPVVGNNFQFPNNEIRLHRISAISERCHPLAVLRTISASVRCKLEPSLYPTTDQSELMKLHASCFYERKTAVAIIGNEELHLVAMPSKLNRFPYFWCYSVPVVGTLYHYCLEMLNIRCLAVVFDLDETLIVANTMKSFKDKIEALRGRIARESDPIRSSGMTAEMNRYIEDRSLLKQYVKSDSLVDNGKFHKAKLEYTTQERGFRPVIRLLEKNVVLTRIIPENRDTSVLVRLRPAWDELKSYLTANGRKRFEVYVCTKAEKEYALEMWRLLDPNANLISLNQRINRVVSVKHGTKKSLINVFQQGSCHPKMAMVIDDRVDVWDDKDKPRVHVLPAFTPYHSPAAETVNSVPVLRVVRDVVCNARGKFFKEFDESFLHKISAASYEDDVVSFPVSPEVAPNAVEVVPSSFKKPSNLVGSLNKLPANMNEYRTVETWNYIPPVAIHALLEFGRQLNSAVEFKPVARKNDYFGYSFEIWFGGEMAGIGVGKTMKDAQLQAADKAIRALTDKYLSYNQKQTLNKIWTRTGDPLVGC